MDAASADSAFTEEHSTAGRKRSMNAPRCRIWRARDARQAVSVVRGQAAPTTTHATGTHGCLDGLCGRGQHPVQHLLSVRKLFRAQVHGRRVVAFGLASATVAQLGLASATVAQLGLGRVAASTSGNGSWGGRGSCCIIVILAVSDRFGLLLRSAKSSKHSQSSTRQARMYSETPAATNNNAAAQKNTHNIG